MLIIKIIYTSLTKVFFSDAPMQKSFFFIITTASFIALWSFRTFCLSVSVFF